MALSSKNMIKNIRTLGNLEIETYKCEMVTNYGDVHAYLHHGFASFLLSKVKVSIRYVKFLAFEFHLGEVYKGKLESRKQERVSALVRGVVDKKKKNGSVMVVLCS
jgi:hypothetical protein